MTGDEGDYWRDVKEARRRERDKHGIECVGCMAKEPNRNPTILMPQQKCRVCGYRDPRKEGKDK